MEENNTPQAFVNTNGKSGFNLGRFFNRKTLGLLVILILVAAVPLIVMVSQQSQDIRQRAASSSNLLPANLQSATFTNDPGTGASGRVWPIPQQSVTTNYVLSGTIENLSAKVGGVPYKAELAVDIYDSNNQNGNYNTRIVSSSNSQENVSGPKTFTVNANYKAYLIFRTYNATANFKNISLASKVTGPCYGRAAGTCTFDTRTFNPVKNNREEITAYGKYWNIVDNAGNLAPGTEGNGDLTSIPRYSASNGPCAGKSEGQCKLNTRFFYTDIDNHIIEIITANNREYAWDNSDQFLPYTSPFFGYIKDGNQPTDYRGLYDNDPDSVCYGKTNSDCIFDTQLVVRLNNRLIESVTAYGKGWNWDLNNLTPPETAKSAFPGQQAFNLTSIDKYKNGPCAGKSGSDCKFDTRTFFTHSDGSQIESITAYGKYFNFLNNNPWSTAPTGDLTSLAKYTKVYDDRLNLNILPSDLQNPTFTNDPGVGRYDIEPQPVARTFTLSGAINNFAAKVGGTPYQAEVAVDIYDNVYPAPGYTANYDNRIIKSSDASKNRNGPLTFTVPANYKAFVMYRLYNATAKFENMSLTYDIPNTPVPTPIPPTTPAGLQGNCNSTYANGTPKIYLSWSPSTGIVNYYKVCAMTGSGNQCTPNEVQTASEGFDMQAAAGTTYRFKVRAGNHAGSLSEWSGETTITCSASVPTSTPLPTATPIPVGNGGQIIRVEGKVIDVSSQNIQGVKVWISDESSSLSYHGGIKYRVATTNINGDFSENIKLDSQGRYWVRLPDGGDPETGQDGVNNRGILRQGTTQIANTSAPKCAGSANPTSYECQSINNGCALTSPHCSFKVQRIPQATPTPLTAPAGATATCTVTAVATGLEKILNVSWSSVTGASKYRINLRDANEADMNPGGIEGTSTSYRTGNVLPNHTYTGFVAAVDTAGNRGNQATFTAACPPAPTATAIPTYSILGTVYLDTNGNGQKDSNENAASIGTPSIEVDSTTSHTVVRAGDSTYHSDNLSPKEYYLTFTVPTGYKLTARNISISTGDSGTCYTVAATWTAIPLSECVGGKRFQTKFNIASSNVTVNFGIQPLQSQPAATATSQPAATATSIPPTATSVPAATATSVPATATPTTSTSNNLAADVDRNGCISINDFNAWLWAFWHNGTPTNTSFKPDMNGNGQVTLEDYNVWYSAYRAGQNLCQ